MEKLSKCLELMKVVIELALLLWCIWKQFCGPVVG